MIQAIPYELRHNYAIENTIVGIIRDLQFMTSYWP